MNQILISLLSRELRKLYIYIYSKNSVFKKLTFAFSFIWIKLKGQTYVINSNFTKKDSLNLRQIVGCWNVRRHWTNSEPSWLRSIILTIINLFKFLTLFKNKLQKKCRCIFFQKEDTKTSKISILFILLNFLIQ